MGRYLRRVPLDFDWGIGEKWKGFVNPYLADCPHCEGMGETSAMRRLDKLVSLIIISGEDANRGEGHPYFYGIESYLEQDTTQPVSKDMVELTAGLAERSPEGRLGHDAIDRATAIKNIVEAAGLDLDTWGDCEHCDGSGLHPDHKEEIENWEPYDPPEGEGYQLWEDTSEGSPCSPVFSTMEELAEWCEGNATVFGREKTSKENWLKMFEDGNIHHQKGNVIFI